MNIWILPAIIYVDGQGESRQVIKFYVLKLKVKRWHGAGDSSQLSVVSSVDSCQFSSQWSVVRRHRA